MALIHVDVTTQREKTWKFDGMGGSGAHLAPKSPRQKQEHQGPPQLPPKRQIDRTTVSRESCRGWHQRPDSSVFWLKYSWNGKTFRESAHTDDKRKAGKKLRHPSRRVGDEDLPRSSHRAPAG